MKTLLVNGCSFGHCWTPSDRFIKRLNCDKAVNISKIATSFQRACRTTVEWIAKNGNPHFVIIPVTFTHRWELAVSGNDDDLDGQWFPLQRKELVKNYQNTISPLVDQNKLEKLIDLYYGSIPNIVTYWDKAFTEIIMLSGFLKSKNVKHLIFDMCNVFEREHIKGYKSLEKLKLIEQNKSVIDLFAFSGNKFMWNTLKDKEKIDFNTHHAPEQYLELEDFLANYLEK
jgi:hypothetical protein